MSNLPDSIKSLFPTNTDIVSHIKIWKDITKGRKPAQVIQSAKQPDSRVLVLISRGHRVLLVKVKPTDKDLESSTTWSVDDIKSIEYTHPTAFALHLSRTAFFCTDDTQQLKHFMIKMIKLCQKYAKIPPLVKDKVTLQRKHLFQPMQVDDEFQESINIDYSVLTEIYQDGDGYTDLKHKLMIEFEQLHAANVHSMVDMLNSKKSLINQLSTTMDHLNGMGIWLEAFHARVMDLSKNVNTIETEHKKIQILFANRASLLKVLNAMLSTIDIDDREKDLIQNCDLLTELNEVKAVVVGIYMKLHLPRTKLKCVLDKLSDLNAYNIQLSVRLCRHIIQLATNIQLDYLQDVKRNSGNSFRHMIELEEQLLQYHLFMIWMQFINPQQFNELQIELAELLYNVWQNDIQRFVQSRQSKVNQNKQIGIFHQEKEKRSHRKGLSSISGMGGHLSSGAQSTTNQSLATLSPSGNGEAQLEYADILQQLLTAISPKLIRQHNLFDDLMFSTTSFNQMVEHSVVLAINGDKRALAENKKLTALMQTIFGTLLNEMNRLIDMAIKQNEMVIFKLLLIITDKQTTYLGTNIQFMQDWLKSINERLRSAWDDYIRQLIINIHSYKRDSVVFGSISLFGVFIEKIEMYLLSNNNEDTQYMALHVYDLMTKEFIKVIENAVLSEKDPFEAQIMQMTNMHELHAILRPYKKINILQGHVQQTQLNYTQSLEQYVSGMLRKQFTKIFDFFDKLEQAKLNCPAHELQYQQEYSKQIVRKILQGFNLKEFKKILESIYKRVEKQFVEHGLLLQVVWRSFQEGVLFQHERITRNLIECYPNTGLEIEFGIPDILQVISDLARV